MKKTQNNLYVLYMIFATCLVTCNAIASKIFDTGVQMFGANVTITVGIICYPITFLVTDILGEIWGKKEANKAVKIGFICQLISTFFIIIARYMPAVDPVTQENYIGILGQNWIFVVASLSAYLCSQSWDVWVFHKVREYFINKDGHNKRRWIWNNLSTGTSQFIDSVIYVLVAFGFGFGWLFDSAMRPAMFAMIVGQYVFKLIVAILDTPFFYLFTRKSKEAENENLGDKI